nr:hypothetical protein B0A51_03722 [Rachicladosporium sp. CCFEE 5018]
MASTPCRLLELPPELRLRIYEALYPPGQRYFEMFPAVHIFKTSDALRPKELQQSVRAVALLRTCRQIHTEATPILYKHTVFDITIGTPWWSFEGIPELCSIQDFKLGGPMHSVYLRAPDREAISVAEADACTEVVDKVLTMLGNCASVQRVHLEDSTRITCYGTAIKRHPRALQRFEALQCQGVMTMSLLNLRCNGNWYKPELAAAGTCAEFDGLAKHLGAKVQLCTWHRQDPTKRWHLHDSAEGHRT